MLITLTEVETMYMTVITQNAFIFQSKHNDQLMSVYSCYPLWFLVLEQDPCLLRLSQNLRIAQDPERATFACHRCHLKGINSSDSHSHINSLHSYQCISLFHTVIILHTNYTSKCIVRVTLPLQCRCAIKPNKNK